VLAQCSDGIVENSWCRGGDGKYRLQVPHLADSLVRSASDPCGLRPKRTPQGLEGSRRRSRPRPSRPESRMPGGDARPPWYRQHIPVRSYRA
jgi:hypothetical protein